jgi:hypothetical protein
MKRDPNESFEARSKEEKHPAALKNIVSKVRKPF